MADEAEELFLGDAWHMLCALIWNCPRASVSYSYVGVKGVGAAKREPGASALMGLRARRASSWV